MNIDTSRPILFFFSGVTRSFEVYTFPEAPPAVQSYLFKAWLKEKGPKCTAICLYINHQQHGTWYDSILKHEFPYDITRISAKTAEDLLDASDHRLTFCNACSKLVAIELVKCDFVEKKALFIRVAVQPHTKHDILDLYMCDACSSNGRKFKVLSELMQDDFKIPTRMQVDYE